MGEHRDINLRLSRFVSDPRDFRRALGDNEALIVGSTAFQFFAEVSWPDSSLDVLVERGPAVTEIFAYLLNEGYRQEETGSFYGGLPDQFTYRITPWIRDGATSTKVNVINAEIMSIWGFLVGPAFSTASACFITRDAAYCLFPEHTFGRRKVKFAHGLDTTYDTVSPMLHKYIQRGCFLDENSFTQGPDLAQEREETIADLQGFRRIGDSKTWIIPLDCTGVTPSEVNSTVIERNTFYVRVEEGQSGLEFIIRTGTFKCCVLKHTYTFDALENPNDDFHEYLRWILCRKAAVQIQHHIDNGTFTLKKVSYRQALKKMANATEKDMGGEKGCSEYCHLLESRLEKGGFITPVGWQYADDLIPEIYAEWARRDHGSGRSKIKIDDHGYEVEVDMEDN